MSNLISTTDLSNGMTKAAVYIRVSTDEQAKHGRGLDYQRSEVSNFISRNRMYTDQTLLYKDKGYSGSNDQRPSFQRLMADAKAGKFKVIVVWKIDRFFRNNLALLSYINELGKLGVKFQSATENLEDTAEGKLLLSLLGGMAEMERTRILDRTAKGKMASAQAGNFVGGEIPFGYTSKKIARSNKLVVNKKEALVVQKVFELFTKSDYNICKLADYLSRLKILSRRDKHKQSKRSKNNQGFWSAVQVRRLLSRTHYVGVYYYNRHGKNEAGKIYEKPRKEWYTFACPAIVDETTFRRTQTRLAELKKVSGSALNRYLFSGKIRCHECGSTYTGYVSSKKTKNYRCNRNKSKSDTPCKARQVSEKILLGEIWPNVYSFLTEPREALNLLAKRRQEAQKHREWLSGKYDLEEKLEENQRAFKRVREAYREHGIYSPEEFKNELGILQKSRQELEKELAITEHELSKSSHTRDKILSCQEMAKRLRQNLTRLNYEDQRVILQAILHEVEMRGQKFRVELRIPKANQVLEREQKSLANSDRGKLSAGVPNMESLEKAISSEANLALAGKVNKYQDMCGGTGWI